MVKFYKLSLIFTLGLFIQINSMEPQESQPAQCSQQNKQESSDKINLQDLPIELQFHILQYVAQAKSASSSTEIFKNLAPVYKVNKYFYDLVHYEAFLKTIGKDYFSDKASEKNKDLKVFLHAISNNNLSLIKSMLAFGSNAKDKDGNPALILASRNGHIDIVKVLLDAYANPNIQGSYGNTALMMASLYNHIDIVKVLLSANANPNIQNNKGSTALFLASVNGHINIVNALLNANANPDIQDNFGSTALSDAIHIDIVKALLAANADPNLQDSYGNTALTLKSRSGCIETIKALLNANANPDIRDCYGNTALIIASRTGHIGAVKALLNANANPYIQDRNGETALIAASHIDIVKILESPKIDPDVKNSKCILF